MQTGCASPQRVFEGLGKRQVVGKFDGGRMTSDGGALLLRKADRLFDFTGRLAACFIDHRDPQCIEHPLTPLSRNRRWPWCWADGRLGFYEDINDHDRLRDDTVLAGSSTLNRLELGTP